MLFNKHCKIFEHFYTVQACGKNTDVDLYSLYCFKIYFQQQEKEIHVYESPNTHFEIKLNNMVLSVYLLLIKAISSPHLTMKVGKASRAQSHKTLHTDVFGLSRECSIMASVCICCFGELGPLI